MFSVRTFGTHHGTYSIEHLTKISSSQHNLNTQLEALLRRNEEKMQKIMENALGHIHDKMEKNMTSLKEQHKAEYMNCKIRYPEKMMTIPKATRTLLGTR